MSGFKTLDLILQSQVVTDRASSALSLRVATVPARWRRSLRALLLLGCIALATALPLPAQNLGDVDGDGTATGFLSAPGQASVSRSGAASLSIPIVAPPGVGGMVPSLDLSYSSHGGDSGLGPGWTVGLGFPAAIRRIPTWGVPRYDATDHLVFGGQTLILGEDEIHTRVRNFFRFDWDRRIGGTGGWTVELPTGTVLSYGSTPASRSSVSTKPAEAVIAWHLDRVEDTHGNAIVYEYGTGGDPSTLKVLERVRYTLGEGLTYHQRLELIWADRFDPVGSSAYGGYARWTKRLDRVETHSGDDAEGVGGSLVRTYELCYVGDACDSVAGAYSHQLGPALSPGSRRRRPLPASLDLHPGGRRGPPATMAGTRCRRTPFRRSTSSTSAKEGSGTGGSGSPTSTAMDGRTWCARCTA